MASAANNIEGATRLSDVDGAGMIAVNNLRDRLWSKPGQRVMINGAAGGVGSIAIQLAKAALYHRYAGGKEEMAHAVLAEVGMRRYRVEVHVIEVSPGIRRGRRIEVSDLGVQDNWDVIRHEPASFL
jgi:D-arabinose 1-dehydrogenase-like Zn-dependent alcohol dehydrogenase